MWAQPDRWLKQDLVASYLAAYLELDTTLNSLDMTCGALMMLTLELPELRLEQIVFLIITYTL